MANRRHVKGIQSSMEVRGDVLTRELCALDSGWDSWEVLTANWKRKLKKKALENWSEVSRGNSERLTLFISTLSIVHSIHPHSIVIVFYYSCLRKLPINRTEVQRWTVNFYQSIFQCYFILSASCQSPTEYSYLSFLFKKLPMNWTEVQKWTLNYYQSVCQF